MFVQHSSIVLVFLCFPHYFPHFHPFSTSNPHQTEKKKKRLWWLAASGRPNRPPRDQPGTGPRHSFWEKGGKKWWKVEQKWKGKHGKALFHRFWLMVLFYLFWMLHCIYLQLITVFTYVCPILSLSTWISSTVNPRWINSRGGSLGRRTILRANPSFMFHVSFIDQLIENQPATNTGWHFLAIYHGSMFSRCPMVSPWHLDVSWIAWCFH